MLKDSGHTWLALSPAWTWKKWKDLHAMGEKTSIFTKKKGAYNAFHKNSFFYYFSKSISLVFYKKYAVAIL